MTISNPNVIELNQYELLLGDLIYVPLAEPDPVLRAKTLEAFRQVARQYSADGYRSTKDHPAHQHLRASAYLTPTEDDYQDIADGNGEFTEAVGRFRQQHQRRFNVAINIAERLFLTTHDNEFRGLYSTPNGIFSQVSEMARENGIRGAQDKDTLRGIWNHYRGIIHLPLAMELSKHSKEDPPPLLPFARSLQQAFSQNCPRNSSKPYVPAHEQISFVEISML